MTGQPPLLLVVDAQFFRGLRACTSCFLLVITLLISAFAFCLSFPFLSCALPLRGSDLQ